MSNFELKEDDTSKMVFSDNYNFIFNKKTGFFCRWGETEHDDPDYSKFGPEIFDMEISTICHGVGKPCEFCYKANTSVGENLNIETFKKIFKKLPKTLTQIAFGIGDIDGNPDLWEILAYTRINGIIPNITINGARMTDDDYDKLVLFCGGVAVSKYDDDICFNAIKKLTDRGFKQANIHMLVADETYEECIKLIDNVKTDKRLKKLHAVLFLFLKQKGRGKNLHYLSKEKYKRLIDYATEKEVNFGMDSCSASMFLDSINSAQQEQFRIMVDPCESGLFSAYSNVKGEFFPCSFTEGTENWETGIDIKDLKDFQKDVWYNDRVIKWRKTLIDNCRNCPIYNLGGCSEN